MEQWNKLHEDMLGKDSYYASFETLDDENFGDLIYLRGKKNILFRVDFIQYFSVISRKNDALIKYRLENQLESSLDATLYEISNSLVIDELVDRCCGIYKAKDFKHYVLLTKNLLIDVVIYDTDKIYLQECEKFTFMEDCDALKKNVHTSKLASTNIIPQDGYLIKSHVTDKKELILYMESLSRTFHIEFGEVEAFRLIEEGKDLATPSSEEPYEYNHLKGINSYIYMVSSGGYMNVSNSQVGSYTIMGMDNYNVYVLTQNKPKVTEIKKNNN